MRLRRIASALVFACAAFLAVPASAESDEEPSDAFQYWKVCSLYGAGYAYVPHTDICSKTDNGDTRRQSIAGTIRTWSDLVLRIHDLDDQVTFAIQGAAVTLAIPTPIILQGDRFGIAMNWAHFYGYHALGFSGAFSLGDTFSFNAGIGVGLGNFSVGTRFGLNLNW